MYLMWSIATILLLISGLFKVCGGPLDALSNLKGHCDVHCGHLDNRGSCQSHLDVLEHQQSTAAAHLSGTLN